MNSNSLINIANYHNELSRKHQFIRLIWSIIWPICTWFLPRSVGFGWKRFLLRLFGAKIHKTAHVYSSTKIYYPANLEMEEYSCLADEVNCYNVALVKIGAQSTISQGAFLCTASHDITDPKNHLVIKPIVIEDQAWIGAKAFISMGVKVGQGAVVGATASVFKDVEPWTVVGGNPAKFIKKRELKNSDESA